MHRKKSIIALFVLSIIILLMFSAVSYAVMSPVKDIPTAKEHPLVTRIPNYFITRYEEMDFNFFQFPVGGKTIKKERVEGHYYYHDYKPSATAAIAGPLQIVRNYQNALKSIGGQVMFESDTATTMKVVRDNAEWWLYIKAFGTLYYEIWTIQKKAMVQDVIADASALSQGLANSGHITVNGIFFDTGKSEIKPESQQAISEIAKLLKNEPSLKIHVVGHTDNQGSVTSNMTLSQSRAEAVVKALIAQGIAASRLTSFGAGPYAPVASNRTEEGRAKNRRVEIVEQ